MKEKTHHRIISWYVSLSIILGPILQPYNLFGKSMALVFMLVNVVFFFLYSLIWGRKNKFKPDSSYYLLLFYFLTIPILIGSLLYKVDYGASIRGLLVFSASLLLYASYAELSIIKKIYRFFVIFAIGIFVAQEVFFFLYGTRFPALIPFLEINYEMGMENYAEYLISRERSSSFFLEPAHLALFVLPYFIMKIVDNENENKLLSVEVITLTIFFIYLRSGLGFVCLLTVWAVFFLKSRINRQRKIAFISFVGVSLLMAIFTSDFGDYLNESFFSRAKELSGNSSNGSGMIRVTRGYMVYKDVPIIGKIFGVSNGATSEVVMKSSASRLFNDETYLNNAQKLLIGYGFIGVFLFIYYIIRISKKRNQYTPVLMLVFLEICLMENMQFDGRMLLYFAIAAIPVYKRIKVKEYDKKSIYNY